MKKITVLSMGMCAVLALASCGTSKESAYKKAYEKAQQQEQQAAQAPVAQEPVVAPLETQAPSDEQTEVDNVLSTLIRKTDLEEYFERKKDTWRAEE